MDYLDDDDLEFFVNRVRPRITTPCWSEGWTIGPLLHGHRVEYNSFIRFKQGFYHGATDARSAESTLSIPRDDQLSSTDLSYCPENPFFQDFRCGVIESCSDEHQLPNASGDQPASTSFPDLSENIEQRNAKQVSSSVSHDSIALCVAPSSPDTTSKILKNLCVVFRNGAIVKTSIQAYLQTNCPSTQRVLTAYSYRNPSKSVFAICDSDNPIDQADVLAKLKGNFRRLQFTLYDNGISKKKVSSWTGYKNGHLRQELAAIVYETRDGAKAAPHKMTVILPGHDSSTGKPIIVAPKNGDETLIRRWKENRTADLIVLQNIAPTWNEERDTYTLDFNGRVKLASVKNFQLSCREDNAKAVLQFGRTSDHEFILDFDYPLDFLQAFGIALAAMQWHMML